MILTNRITAQRITSPRITARRARLAMVLLPLSVLLLLMGQLSYAGQIKLQHTAQLQPAFANQRFADSDLSAMDLVSQTLAVNSYSQKRPIKANTYRLAQAGNQISMREAVRRAKRQFPGKVLSAKRSINRKGMVVYRIKIISKANEIRTISIAANG